MSATVTPLFQPASECGFRRGEWICVAPVHDATTTEGLRRHWLGLTPNAERHHFVRRADASPKESPHVR